MAKQTKLDQLTAELDSVTAAIEDMQQRRAQIVADMAQRWGEDNAALEAEYQAMTARLEAAQLRQQVLEQQVKDQRTADILAQLEQRVEAHLAALAVEHEAHQRMTELERQAHDARKEFERLNRADLRERMAIIAAYREQLVAGVLSEDEFTQRIADFSQRRKARTEELKAQHEAEATK